MQAAADRGGCVMTVPTDTIVDRHDETPDVDAGTATYEGRHRAPDDRPRFVRDHPDDYTPRHAQPDCEDSPLPPGAQPDDLVYITTARQGIPYHRHAACGRSTRTGVWIPAGQALTVYGSKPCPRCWPEVTR